MPITENDGVIIADMHRFEFRHARQKHSVERLRAPNFDIVTEGTDLDDWYHHLPRAIWVDGSRSTDRVPAMTIVRRLSKANWSNLPRFQLVICPIWLDRLGWTANASGSETYVDRNGQIVATIVSWRDACPSGVDEDGSWGEGAYVSVTSLGLDQIEALSGPLQLFVHARRTYQSELIDGAPGVRYCSKLESND